MKFPLPNFGPEVCLEKHHNLRYQFYASSSEPMTLKELKSLEDDSIAPMFQELVLSYAESNGGPLLLKEIAKIYGDSIVEENILCFPGAQTGIFTVLTSLLSSKDHCVLISPCYPSLENIPAAICETTKVMLKYADKWQLDLNAIAAAIRPNTKLIVLNSPNNPTGSLISQQAQQELVELARKHGIWIFSDEVYRLLEFDLKDRLAPIAEIYEKGISLGVMSKAYGLGGLCIGWVACQNKEILKKSSDLKHYFAVSNSAVSEIHAIVALRSSEIIVNQRREIILENMQLLDRFFANYHDWFEWIRPNAGCVGFVKFKSSKLSVTELLTQLVEQSEIFVMPASAFDFPEEFFRIGFGRRLMSKSLDQFQSFVDQHKENW